MPNPVSEVGKNTQDYVYEPAFLLDSGWCLAATLTLFLITPREDTKKDSRAAVEGGKSSGVGVFEGGDY